jgi:hypothetical protein
VYSPPGTLAFCPRVRKQMWEGRKIMTALEVNKQLSRKQKTPTATLWLSYHPHLPSKGVWLLLLLQWQA